ncbi:unnamed protein product [Closterium sp. NIES-54]
MKADSCSLMTSASARGGDVAKNSSHDTSDSSIWPLMEAVCFRAAKNTIGDQGGMEYAGVGAGGMEEGMVQLQQRLRSAEAKAEEVLLVKQEVSEGDSLLLGGTFTSPGVAHQRCCASAVVPVAGKEDPHRITNLSTAPCRIGLLHRVPYCTPSHHTTSHTLRRSAVYGTAHHIASYRTKLHPIAPHLTASHHIPSILTSVLSHVQPLPFTSHIHRAAPLSPLAAHPFTIHTRPSHPRLVDTHRQAAHCLTGMLTKPLALPLVHSLISSPRVQCPVPSPSSASRQGRACRRELITSPLPLTPLHPRHYPSRSLLPRIPPLMLVLPPRPPLPPSRSGSPAQCAQRRQAGRHSSAQANPLKLHSSYPLTSSLLSPPIPSHPTPSHPIPPHPIPSHPIPSHPIPSHPIPGSASGSPVQSAMQARRHAMRVGMLLQRCAGPLLPPCPPLIPLFSFPSPPIPPPQLVDLDRQRNAGREAITALKKHARGAAARRAGARKEGGPGGGAAGEGVSAESHRPLVIPLPAVPCGMSDSVGGSECAVCGAVGQKERVWVAMGGGEMFVRMPLHHAHVHVKRGE